MSRLSPYPRRRSSANIASDTAHHNHSRAALHEPVVPCDSSKETETLPTFYGMQRQDSGYESLVPTRSQTYSRRRSSTSVVSSGSRSHIRPSVRRASKSGPVAYDRQDSTQPARAATCCQRYRQREDATYYFPQLAPVRHDQAPGVTTADHNPPTTAAPYVTGTSHGLDEEYPSSGTSMYPSPPQTTHYWTSDRTRRLEYAAIDAASRGVRGWVMRHMVPDCFIPEDYRRVRFDDDRGSVVRYRLDLEGEDQAGKEGSVSTKKRRSRWFGSSPS